ncbi:MAG: patatin-like phospholipase family protein, partial [Hyphomicrobiaceae bacterium]
MGAWYLRILQLSNIKHSIAVLSAIMVPVMLAGCAASVLRVPVPNGLADKVEVQGVGRVRTWGDVAIDNIEQLAAQRIEQIRQTRPQLLKRRRVDNYLALSGGGSNGAFGAGFLNGWTASGKRPVFEIVSGVSAGALIAPFAFLGSAYDRQLKEIYTLYSTKDILRPQVLAG